jgi:hypothetical protein
MSLSLDTEVPLMGANTLRYKPLFVMGSIFPYILFSACFNWIKVGSAGKNDSASLLETAIIFHWSEIIVAS